MKLYKKEKGMIWTGMGAEENKPVGLGEPICCSTDENYRRPTLAHWTKAFSVSDNGKACLCSRAPFPSKICEECVYVLTRNWSKASKLF